MSHQTPPVISPALLTYKPAPASLPLQQSQVPDPQLIHLSPQRVPPGCWGESAQIFFPQPQNWWCHGSRCCWNCTDPHPGPRALAQPLFQAIHKGPKCTPTDHSQLYCKHQPQKTSSQYPLPSTFFSQHPHSRAAGTMHCRKHICRPPLTIAKSPCPPHLFFHVCAYYMFA